MYLSTKSLLRNELNLLHNLDMIEFCETQFLTNFFFPLNKPAQDTEQDGGVALISVQPLNTISHSSRLFEAFVTKNLNQLLYKLVQGRSL